MTAVEAASTLETFPKHKEDALQDAPGIAAHLTQNAPVALRRESALSLGLVALHALLSWPTLFLYYLTADVPAMYLASGVTVAGFMLLGRRGQTLFAAGVFTSQFLGELVVYGSPIVVGVIFSASKTLTGFLAAWAVHRVLGQRGLPPTVHALTWFGAIACVAVPLLTAVPPQLTKMVFFDPLFAAYWRWALLEACGIAIMAPTLLFWLQPRSVSISDSRAEAVLIVMVSALVLISVYVLPPIDPHQHTPFYAATPVMIWAAARFGCRGAALVNLSLTLIMIGAALLGLGPFHDQSDVELSVIELQLFLMIVAGMTLLLGAYAEARELAQQHRADDKRRLQSLSMHLLESEERYRENIAIRLHDGIGQTLSLGRMRLEDVLSPPISPDALSERLSRIETAFDTAIVQVRDMTRDVSAGLYRGNDIGAAVSQHLMTVFEDTGVATTLNSEGVPELPHEVAVVISRAVRECLVNAAKHANASEVRVGLAIQPRPERFVVTIADNGAGFDPSALDIESTAADSFGLASVRNAMLALGGGFRIEAAPGRGTQVILTLPQAQQTH
ncbi:MAG: MASE1 domain-containing protein [Pseudomonadota bacterium]